jgi:peptide-methionine (S)-S-oxide reductase
MENATFAAGCFWGVEETFRRLEGVKSTAVGYIGGNTKNPTYEQVCRGDTNHAEGVQIEFDPEKISYQKLLNIFWDNHNPTTPNRQGPDIGTQYRSAVFYHSEAQKEAAEKSKEEHSKEGKWAGRQIVTQIVPAAEFWMAEDYHQQYLLKRGRSVCH